VIRKTGRILTRRYDRYLKPSGLKITQFSMLANIARNPGITVSDLAELLLMDQTTVSRNLRVLEKSGYAHMEPEVTDHRIKRIRIADSGMAKMDEARPLWEKAQREMERVLGREGIEGLLAGLGKMAG
jgi:DNA-binding MarR family transcriptional regulator